MLELTSVSKVNAQTILLNLSGKSTFGRGTLQKKSYQILIRTTIFLFQKIAAKRT
jgi:hypothetical protein